MPEDAFDFGAHLRHAREQTGRSLREIASSTKISVLALEALERNDASRLPGGIFSRAFVRAYAKEVGLDPEEAVRRFVARFPEASMEETPQAYEPNPDRIITDEPAVTGRLWRAAALSLPIVLVIAYFGYVGRLPFWSSLQPGTDPLNSTTPAVTTPVAPPASPQAAVPQASGQAGSTDPQAVPATPPASSPAVVPASDAVVTPPAVPGTFRLRLAPRGPCWVSVRIDGERVFAGMMQGGEQKDLDLRGEVSLTVGDAGVFTFTINGQVARSLGPAGQLVTARLNAGNLATYLETR
jgi:cytoskeletal protein RodZ